MKLVIIESPYGANTQEQLDKHIDYAQAALSDSLARGEAPLASHLLYTQVLDDKNPDARKQGIEAGYAWMRFASTVVFYMDLGLSPGMIKAKQKAFLYHLQIEERYLYPKAQSHK